MEDYTDLEIIWEFQRRLLATYENEELTCIAGLDNRFTINGENVLESYMRAMRKGQELYHPVIQGEKPKFDYNRARDDLKLISDEILHFTGLTCLYSNHLSSPLNRPIPLQNGGIVYSNFQELPDKRFYMYATSAYEKLYNFWDRIGDLLASYFPENISPDKVYFSKIERFIPPEIQDHASIQWLINFKNNQFSDLNKLRIGIVHYESLDTAFAAEHLEHSKNRTQLDILIQNRSQIIPDLKVHIGLTLDGYVQTIRFMEYLSEEILTEQEIENKRQHIT